MTLFLIKPTGSIDAAIGLSLLEQVRTGLEQGKLIFSIDFSSVYALDEQGLERFLQSLKIIYDAGGEHRIFSINADVHKLFVLKGLDTVLNLIPSNTMLRFSLDNFKAFEKFNVSEAVSNLNS
ncbi:STAS domain-containing protein [Altericista sp. CCNU0014]|uniref:STAS domain-containing protein n=1 Tax=Altericista sp. CCNU0014 TaxID=3082949 RepID=UPI00384F86F5